MHKPVTSNPHIPQRSSAFSELQKKFGGGGDAQVSGAKDPQPSPSKLAVARPHTPPVSVATHQAALPTVEAAKSQLDKTTDARPVQDLGSGGTKLQSSPQFLQLKRPEVPTSPKPRVPSQSPAKGSPVVTPSLAKASPVLSPSSPKTSPVVDPSLAKGSPVVSPSSPKASPVDPSSPKAVPQGPVVKFSESDFLYGPDTGVQKPRTLLRKYVQGKSEEGGQKVWRQQIDDTLKIDSLTSGMGPTPPKPTRHQLGGKALGGANPNGPASTEGALPSTWKSNVGISVRNNVRAQDKADFVSWIADHPRFSPDLSPEHTDWNARFKRTSKAGLQFALKEKGYNVHFVLPKGTDFDQIVREAGSHPRHASAKYEAYYQDGSGKETGPIEEKRITHAELRWLYRHKDDPAVKQNVQFWEYDATKGTDGFTPVAAPWVRDSTPWDEYAKGRAAKASRNGDTYSIEPKAPVVPAPTASFVATDAHLTPVK